MVEQGEKKAELWLLTYKMHINSVDILVEDKVLRVIGNHFVDLEKVVPFDVSDLK